MLVVSVGIGAPAWADRLEAPADAPLLARLAVDALLYLHIGGGALGLTSGTIAILSRKGAPTHRLAGRVFFLSMFVSYAIGAGVAPFLESGQRPNFIAGIVALYLLLTAWRAARRSDLTAGAAEYAGLVAAALIVAAGVLFSYQGANHPSGTVDGSPPQAFILFMVVGGFAVLGDVHLILRRQLSRTARIARHLWRMCTSLFIAAASFFFGQQQFLPDFMIGTPWQYGPVLFPLIALVVWQVLIRIPKRRAPRPA
ncbi:hypothetical protein GCM10011367_24340 [Marinicauda pacifica]|nr:hypothetical protein GCM10011367_24340 [Marinicauda pacifica]